MCSSPSRINCWVLLIYNFFFITYSLKICKFVSIFGALAVIVKIFSIELYSDVIRFSSVSSDWSRSIDILYEAPYQIFWISSSISHKYSSLFYGDFLLKPMQKITFSFGISYPQNPGSFIFCSILYLTMSKFVSKCI